MAKEIYILCCTAASIGFIHTILGPDHYLPFIMMSKARGWSFSKTSWITLLCGIGHILGSVVLGVIGVVFGVVLMKLEAFESFRGNLAAWALIGFGFAYFIWGLRKAVKNKPHTHIHFHDDESIHSHEHAHVEGHAHVHLKEGKKNITPWVLFTIFVLGPCEPLIPILMYPAANANISGLMLVTGVFGVTTIATMLAVVLTSSWGFSFVPLGKFERYAHAMAGGTICISGLAIRFLGL